MKVWTVEKGYYHEGSDVLGVFSTKEKAAAFCQKNFNESGYSEDEYTLHFVNNHAEYANMFYYLEEHEIDKE